MATLDPRQRSRARARDALNTARQTMDDNVMGPGGDPLYYAQTWALIAIAEHFVGEVPSACTKDGECPVPPSLDDHWPGCPVQPF